MNELLSFSWSGQLGKQVMQESDDEEDHKIQAQLSCDGLGGEDKVNVNVSNSRDTEALSIRKKNEKISDQLSGKQFYRDFATYATQHDELSNVNAPNQSIEAKFSQLAAAARAAGDSAKSSENESNFRSGNTITGLKTVSKSLAFPVILHYVLEHAEESGYDLILSWQYHGRAFQVHDPDRFVKEVMPHFFQQTKYQSFLRQLALYDFQRIKGKDNPDDGCYYHEMFLRGIPHLSSNMARARAKGSSKERPFYEPDFSSMPVVGLKKRQRNLSSGEILNPKSFVLCGMQNPSKSNEAILSQSVTLPSLTSANVLMINNPSYNIPQHVVQNSWPSESQSYSMALEQPFNPIMNLSTTRQVSTIDNNPNQALSLLAFAMQQMPQPQIQLPANVPSNQINPVTTGLSSVETKRDFKDIADEPQNSELSADICVPMDLPTDEMNEPDHDLIGFLSDVDLSITPENDMVGVSNIQQNVATTQFSTNNLIFHQMQPPTGNAYHNVDLSHPQYHLHNSQLLPFAQSQLPQHYNQQTFQLVPSSNQSQALHPLEKQIIQQVSISPQNQISTVPSTYLAPNLIQQPVQVSQQLDHHHRQVEPRQITQAHQEDVQPLMSHQDQQDILLRLRSQMMHPPQALRENQAEDVSSSQYPWLQQLLIAFQQQQETFHDPTQRQQQISQAPSISDKEKDIDTDSKP